MTSSGGQGYHFIWMGKDSSTEVTLMTKHAHLELESGENVEKA